MEPPQWSDDPPAVGDLSVSRELQPVGHGDYVIGDGECMMSVAARFGFFWKTLWYHPDNAALRTARRDPRVLLKGDRVTIPPKTQGEAIRETEKRHRFRLLGEPAKLRLRLLTDGEPRANQRCIVTVDGRIQKTRTDADGVMEVSVPASAREGIVRVGTGEDETTYIVRLGELDPEAGGSGVAQRLSNLGVLETRGGEASAVDVAAALRAFQTQYGLTITGRADEATCRKLKQVHGS